MKNAGSLHDSEGNIAMTIPTKISIRETRVQLSRLSQGMGAAQACHLNFMGFTWDSHGIHMGFTWKIHQEAMNFNSAISID